MVIIDSLRSRQQVGNGRQLARGRDALGASVAALFGIRDRLRRFAFQIVRRGKDESVLV